MGYVKMPGMLSPELIKALSSNVYTVEEEQGHKEETAGARKESLLASLRKRKDEGKKVETQETLNDIDICCPRKVKFIFVLNNAVVINVNSITEEDAKPE